MWSRVDVFTLALCLACSWSAGVFGRQFSKCEFAQEMRRYFAEEEIPAWTCIAQFESEFRTDAINPSNSDGSSDHGIFQINDRYWCGRNSGSNTCGVECARLRVEDLSESVRCAQIVKDKQGFTAWAVWPRCKGQTATYLDECSGQSFLPPTIFDIQVRPANRGPGFNQTRITSALRAFQQPRNQGIYSPYNALNDSRPFNLTSIGAMNFLGGRSFQFRGHVQPLNSTLNTGFEPTRYQPILSSIGGMNFLGGAQVPRRSYPSAGHLRNNGGMSFLGFPATRLTFSTGSQLPDAGILNPPPKLNNFRYSGLLNTMTLIGHAYDANYPAPVKGLIYRSGQGILANQGAMNFLGGIQGIPFRRQPTPTISRTVMIPSVRPLYFTPRPRVRQSFQARIVPEIPRASRLQNTIPLQHLRAGSLLDQIPPRRTTYVFNQPSMPSAIVPHRQSLVFAEPGSTPQVDVSDYLIDFNQILPKQNYQQTISAPPRIQSSRLRSSEVSTFAPSRSAVLNPSPISNLFQRDTIYRSAIPQTSQVKGPVLSYSTGNMFFSLGTSSGDREFKFSPQRNAPISPETFLDRNTPRSNSIIRNAPQTTFVLNSPQSRKLSLTFPQAGPGTKDSRQSTFSLNQQRVAQSTLPPRSTFTVSTTPFTFPSNPLPSNKRRTAYGYQPQVVYEENARIPNTRTATSRLLPRSDAFQGAVRGGSFQSFQLLPRNSENSATASIGPQQAPPRISISRLRAPVRNFSPAAGGPIQSPLFAGFPQKVQAHMPDGYGGVSYTSTNGVMTMVKHYG